MARQGIHVEGLADLEKALIGLRQEMNLTRASAKNVVRRALIDASKPVEQDAEARAPVFSGHLKRSFASGPTLSKKLREGHRKESEVEIFVGPGHLAQAIMQEFGTSAHPAQPFLRPSWDSNRMGVLNSLTKSFANQIEKARARLARKAEREALKIKAGG